jgi:hypothetical protein
MKKILRNPNEGRFNNADHIEFHKLSHGICDEYGIVINAPVLLTTYRDKVVQEDNIYKWLRKSDYTEKKAEADNSRDRIFLGITGIVKANLKHFDPSIRDNASHVNNLLANYGDLTHTGYDAETASIDSVVTRLNSADYLPAVKNLGLETWITELENQNTLFKTYVDDTAQEQIDKPDISPRAARHETDEALRAITNRVTSLVILNGQEEFAEFIEKFNVLVNHYNTLVNEHYGRLHAKTDITPAVIEPVPVQPYTGKPVYVIPSLSIVKKAKDGAETVVELIFSEDYTVAYKNNVEPGTATLTITGIGQYTGKIVTTFNISHEV